MSTHCCTEVAIKSQTNQSIRRSGKSSTKCEIQTQTNKGDIKTRVRTYPSMPRFRKAELQYTFQSVAFGLVDITTVVSVKVDSIDEGYLLTTSI